MENKRAPWIRFEGYNEEWEESKLDTIVERIKSYSLSRNVETNEYTGYKYVHYGDIHTGVANTIDESSNLPNIETGNYELLEKGDVVLADASEDYQGIAKPAVVMIDPPYKLVSGLHTIALRPKKVDPLFLYYLIHSQTFRKYGYKTGTGMKVFGISVKNVLDFKGRYPLLEEQEKIGNFFRELDDTITIQEQELDTLQQTKQGFFQKIFPKYGENLPEIRFPGFTGNWERYKLEDVANYRRGSFPQPYGNKEWYDEEKGMPFVQVVDVGENLKLVDDTKQKISKLAQPKSVFVEKGKIIITLQGSIGRVAITQYDSYVDRTLLIFDDYKVPINKHYFAYIIQRLFEREKQMAPGGTIKTITKLALSKFVIPIPSQEEQAEIGNFLKQLDETIALHEQELETLKQTKKAFLQKMFV